MKTLLVGLGALSLAGCASIDLVGDIDHSKLVRESHVSFFDNRITGKDENSTIMYETYDDGTILVRNLSVSVSNSGKQGLYFRASNLTSEYGFCSVKYKYQSELQDITEEQYWIIGGQRVGMGVYCKEYSNESGVYYQIAYPLTPEGEKYLLDLFKQADLAYAAELENRLKTSWEVLSSNPYYARVYLEIKESPENSTWTEQQVGETARLVWAEDVAKAMHLVTIEERSSKHSKSYQLNPSGFSYAWDNAGGDAL